MVPLPPTVLLARKFPDSRLLQLALRRLTPQRAIYFSFVTQATLGYGDIAPLGEQVQGLAVAQGVGGQMYLVVLVARLVSLYSAQWSR